MKFECFTRWDQLPESANALFEQGEEESIFYSRQWLENLSAVLGDSESLVLACVTNADTILTILPLINCGGNFWSSLTHRYTTHYSFLLSDDDQQQALSCLAQGLSQLPIRSLTLEHVADDDDRIKGLQQALESAGFHCEYTFRHYNWIYHLHEQSYEEYMAARPSWLRNTITRKRRKLEREHSFEIRLYTGEEVPSAMADYYKAYNASWKANEQFRDFLDSIVDSFSHQNWTRLAVLYVDKKPIAAQLWFVRGHKANIFRLAYDKAWRPYSPGSILTSYLMEYVIDKDKVEEIDFLTGNDAYKKDWMSERRERFTLSCIKNKEPAGRYKQFTDFLARLFRLS